jgi:hypothetical protein
VKRCQDNLERALLGLLVHSHRDTPAVVLDADGSVFVERDLHLAAKPFERLVHGVVDELVHEMMEPLGAGVADVHGGPLSDGIETF